MKPGHRPLFKVLRYLWVVTLLIAILTPWCWGGTGQSKTSGNAPSAGTAGDPLTTSTGELFFSRLFLNLGGPLPVFFQLYYAGRLDKGLAMHDDPFAMDGFTHNYHISLTRDSSNSVSIFFRNGNTLTFEKNGTWSIVNEGMVYQLKEDTDYYYLMDPVREWVYTFKKETAVFGTRNVGVLTRIEDRNGNTLSFTQTTDTIYWLLDRVEDGLGRSLDFTYENPSLSWTYPHLKTVTDSNGRQIQFTYDIDLVNFTVHLASVTDCMGQTTSFTHSGPATNSVVSGVTLPRGNTPYTETYSQDPDGWSWRADSQSDAHTNTSTLTYDDVAGSTTLTDPQANTTRHTYQDRRLLTEWVDEEGNAATFAYDADERRTGMTDRAGGTTTTSYHPETGKIASYQNAAGHTTAYTYTAQDQAFTNPDNATNVTFTFYDLTRIDYQDGTNTQAVYDVSGNILSRVDKAGSLWTYTFNAQGLVLSAVNPSGGVITKTYNADGTAASRTDSDKGVTTYGYDVYKRLIQVTWADGTSAGITYNMNDQIVRVTDENGNFYDHAYDANGNLVTVTDPAGSQIHYSYDPMDNLIQVTDRLGMVKQYTYDTLNRIAVIADPTGVQAAYGYNTRGWLSATTIGGQAWQKTYDNEGVVTSTTTPLGNTTAFQTDPLGYATRITGPLGNQTDIVRDSQEKITQITDPLSRVTRYNYNDLGQLTGVVNPSGATSAYTRSGLGLVTRITDPGTSVWDFDYTAMGRLNTVTDPLGSVWQHTYDNRGRAFRTTYPDGETLDRTYDSAGNLLRRLYSDGTDLNYTYDALNRLVTADGIAFTRDNEGRITATDNGGALFGAGYDAAGRLTTATYNNGALTVTYTYDPVTGLLTSVTDSLTGSQVALTYDNDARPVGITRSNGVNTTLTWDAAARLTRIRAGGIIDITYTLNNSGEAVSADMTVPLDPNQLMAGATDTYTVDAASQVSTAGYSYARGKMTASPGNVYTWQGPSWLVSLNAVNFTYNGLGDLVTRSEAGTTLHYYYNYAINLNPVVAERDDTQGSILRYYVWSPSGNLLYMIDADDGNAVYFYHFDRAGSTLALTDASGTVTDAYVYTPFGRLLGHNGSSMQPFTFMGEWGVRQEGVSGTFYQMRARYYDSETARFINRDLLWPFLFDPKGLNPYQYAYNSPVDYMDVTGLSPTSVASKPPAGSTPSNRGGTALDAIPNAPYNPAIKSGPTTQTGIGTYQSTGTPPGSQGAQGTPVSTPPVQPSDPPTPAMTLKDKILAADAAMGTIRVGVVNFTGPMQSYQFSDGVVGEGYVNFVVGATDQALFDTGRNGRQGNSDSHTVVEVDPSRLAALQAQGNGSGPVTEVPHYSVRFTETNRTVTAWIYDNVADERVGCVDATVDQLYAGKPLKASDDEITGVVKRDYTSNPAYREFGNKVSDIIVADINKKRAKADASSN